jgi:cytochrome c553
MAPDMKLASAFLSICLLGSVAATALANEAHVAAKADVVKGEATAAVCSACHAADGSRGSPAQPILQGQHPEYLVKQLTQFKSGVRKNAIMSGIAMTLSEDDMRNVAAYYSGKKAKDGFAKSPELAALGEKIWRGGITDRNVPACAACHGPNGGGIPSQYPRMSGQHAEYTESQLISFRGGVRVNSAQMTGVAAKMNDKEIKAVSDYIAGLH